MGLEIFADSDLVTATNLINALHREERIEELEAVLVINAIAGELLARKQLRARLDAEAAEQYRRAKELAENTSPEEEQFWRDVADSINESNSET